jgi:O-acetyl-ADP-ribose deacetylase (regulator of RNase III)
MISFNAISIPILATAVLSLVIGLALFWSSRKSTPGSSPRATNLVAWLLIALFPVLILFSFFPTTTVKGTVLGFSATGAAALFIFIWWYGSKRALEAIAADEATAANQLNDRIRGLESDLEKCKQATDAIQPPQVLAETQAFQYPLLSSNKKSIGLVTGNIQGVTVADIWVNSENSNMQMSRWYEGNISGMIRYLGAKKDEGGEITPHGDIVASELSQRMGAKTRVERTTVFITSPGELAKTHNVKALFHVASVQGAPGMGYRPVENIEDCVTKILERAESDDPVLKDCKSVLIPLLGSGTGQGELAVTAEKLVMRAISYLESHPAGRIRSVYFLTWTRSHFEICKKVLEKSGRVKGSF